MQRRGAKNARVIGRRWTVDESPKVRLEYRVVRFFFRQPRGAVPALDLGAAVTADGLLAPVDVLSKRTGFFGESRSKHYPFFSQGTHWQFNPPEYLLSQRQVGWLDVRNPDESWWQKGEPRQPVRLPNGRVSWISGQHLDGSLVPTVPCDERCISARGHKCECACGGANHGAGMTLAWIPMGVAEANRVIRDMGYDPRALSDVAQPGVAAPRVKRRK